MDTTYSSLPGLIALIVGGACSTAPVPATTAPVASAATDESRPEATPVVDDGPMARQSDDQISRAVAARFAEDSDAGLRSIVVTTESGVVTLRGSVSTPGARNVAVFLTDDVTGVVSVVNELVIETDYDGGE